LETILKPLSRFSRLCTSLQKPENNDQIKIRLTSKPSKMKTKTNFAGLMLQTDELSFTQMSSIRGGSEQKFGKTPLDEDILLPDPEPDPVAP
jgi:hypothetical protein